MRSLARVMLLSFLFFQLMSSSSHLLPIAVDFRFECFSELLEQKYDITIKIVTPRGRPIEGASVKVGSTMIGVTDQYGQVTALGITGGTYALNVNWLGRNVSPMKPLVVTGSGEYTLVAGYVALVQILVIGALGQGLGGSSVTVTPTGTTTPVFTGLTGADGSVTLELPYGSYDIKVYSRGIETATTTMQVTGDATQKINTGVFVEIFGQALTFTGFALWSISIVVLASILYLVYRKYKSWEGRVPPPPAPA